ncbi:hypothetical protein LVD17_15040 [Fulvivirga ulvae]|uniref:hypothetical protein n=1 Tax=Fulvivirga ulvae TaxID=2904245 RepID=UPI001F2CB93D|nr:hypothetical protein [Fulvivirga ulvae]UII29614.1 hypothetical protein LVD17_15040 [Fulvivirga ulvae]
MLLTRDHWVLTLLYPVLQFHGLGLRHRKSFGPLRGLGFVREKINELDKIGWIADLSQADVFSPKDVSWVAENWNPRASKAGVSYIGFVVSENALAEMTADDYTEQTQEAGELTVNHFKDMDAAKTWLREVLLRA